METILIVDDDVNLCKVLKEELEGYGYKTEYICNGQEALEIISNTKVDIVLLDLNMPVINGYAVLSELNKFKDKAIILTAYTDLKHSVKAIKFGARAIIKKPFKTDVVIKTIRDVLMRER